MVICCDGWFGPWCMIYKGVWGIVLLVYDRTGVVRIVLVVLSLCWCDRGTMGRFPAVALLSCDFQKRLRSLLVDGGNTVGLYSLLLHCTIPYYYSPCYLPTIIAGRKDEGMNKGMLIPYHSTRTIIPPPTTNHYIKTKHNITLQKRNPLPFSNLFYSRTVTTYNLTIYFMATLTVHYLTPPPPSSFTAKFSSRHSGGVLY